MQSTGVHTLPETRGGVYYGWVVLGVAALAMVGTLPGRTQGLGLITEPLLRDLGLGRVAYAQINLVATLVMIVKEKQTDIAILRTMGAAPNNVLRMFLVQGAIIGLVGTIAGVLLGWLLASYVTEVVHAIERAFGIQFLDASVYLMSDLPSEVRIGDVLKVGGVSLALAAVATIYPSWRAARTLPAEALRHE